MHHQTEYGPTTSDIDGDILPAAHMIGPIDVYRWNEHTLRVMTMIMIAAMTVFG